MIASPTGQVIALSELVHDLHQNIITVALDVELGVAQALFENLADFVDARRKSAVILEATRGIKRHLRTPAVLIAIAITEALIVGTVKLLSFGLHFDVRQTG